MRNSVGQVAVILIVIIAIGLVLFAASINLTIMSQSKTLTMKAASASSSTMASMIASYGERLYQETLGGHLEKCHKSSGFGFLLVIIEIVIAIIFVQPEMIALVGAQAAATIAASAIIGAVMEAASVAIMATIDPGIADMWNKMQTANLSQTGQFVERGIQTALQNAVTDQVKIPDLYDMDQDGLFGYPGGDETKPPLDTISRFSLYNTKRFLDLPPTDTSKVEAFVNDLHELVLAGNDNWGLWDPVFYPNLPPDVNSPTAPACHTSSDHPCCKGMADLGNFPAQCDICCQASEGVAPAYCFPPGSANNPITAEKPLGVTQIGDFASCASRSPFRTAGNEYSLIYDPTYEDSTNTFMSFREQLGRDDEHHLYHVSNLNPNWHVNPIAGAQTLNTGIPDQGFFLKDSVGYYTYTAQAVKDQWFTPGLPAGPPASPSIYPFLYKMKDWGPDLQDPGMTYNNAQAHWCDPRSGKLVPGGPYPEIGQLDLSVVVPTGTPPAFSGGWCVDRANKLGLLNEGANIGANDPPFVADNVPGLPSLDVPQNQCGYNSNPTPVSDLDQYVRGWKPGADKYCSPTAPYDVDCPKHVNVGAEQANLNCGDTGTDPTLWPDDVLDQIIYGAPVFYALEANLYRQMNTGVGKVALTKALDDWYPGIADWIEPPCADKNNCPGSYTKLPRPGTLWIWRKELQFYNDKIQQWLKPTAGNEYISPACAGPTANWCVPPQPGGNECPGVSASEAATFDANGNGERGDLYDVIQCLKWNAENKVTLIENGFSYDIYGNAAKFQFCFDNCNQANCTNLPRSLVPDFYDGTKFASGKPGYQFDPGNSGDIALFNTCLTNSSTIQQCNTNCADTVIPTGAPYDSHFANAVPTPVTYTAPNLVNIQAIEDWCANPVGGAPACNGAMVLDCATNKQACECSWAGSCGGFAGCTNNMTWFNAVTDALTQANAAPTGSCVDTTGFLDIIQKSAVAAKVQVEKFKHRIAFLEGRYKEAMSMSNTASMSMVPAAQNPQPPEGYLTTGIQKITDFIDGGTDFTVDNGDSPSERFIKARKAMTSASAGDLPNFAIYVWQDSDPTRLNPAGTPRWSDNNGAGGGQGYWHAVKVEVSIPRRCTGSSEACIAWDWPKVVAHESSHTGMFSSWHKICYKLEHLEGMTKTRIIRYDQDKDLRGLVFPGGKKIWESKLSHPNEASPPSPTDLRDACASLIDPDLANWLSTPSDPRSKIGAAFMFNKIPDLAQQGLNTPAGKYTDCWIWVHQALLDHGIQSKSCAEYYVAADGGPGTAAFRVKFVPCIEW